MDSVSFPEVIVRFSKQNIDPREIKGPITPAVNRILRSFEMAYNDMCRIFWERIESQTSDEDKILLYRSFDPSIKQMIDDYRERFY